MALRKIKPIALICCVVIVLAGCSRWVVIGATAAAVGVGAYSYIKGNLERTYDAPIEKVWEATLAAVKELGLKPETEKHDAFTGNIRGRMADGKRFDLKLARLGEKSTEVGIRIGTFGDRVKSEAIHDKIRSNL